MKTTDEILELLRQFKSVAGEKYGIEQLALFGSAARGEQREDSDIDVCVKLHKTTFRTYMAIKEELEHLFHIKVDLLIVDMLRFVERQTVFVLETTADVKTYHDFLTNMSGMVLFNSTCMCLQTIGETIRQVDDLTAGNLFARYPSTPWKQIIGMRNIISHEYLSVDTELVFDITREELAPLLADLRRVLADIDNAT